MLTKADDPKEQNRTSKGAADGQTSITIELEPTTTDTGGQPLHWTSGMNGGENA